MKNNFLTSFKAHLAANNQSKVTRDWSLMLAIVILLGLIIVGWRLFHFWSWEQQLSKINSTTATHQLNESRLNQTEIKLKDRAIKFETVLNSPVPVKDPSL